MLNRWVFKCHLKVSVRLHRRTVLGSRFLFLSQTLKRNYLELFRKLPGCKFTLIDLISQPCKSCAQQWCVDRSVADREQQHVSVFKNQHFYIIWFWQSVVNTFTEFFFYLLESTGLSLNAVVADVLWVCRLFSIEIVCILKFVLLQMSWASTCTMCVDWTSLRLPTTTTCASCLPACWQTAAPSVTGSLTGSTDSLWVTTLSLYSFCSDTKLYISLWNYNLYLHNCCCKQMLMPSVEQAGKCLHNIVFMRRMQNSQRW